jgi:hypothetical protein
VSTIISSAEHFGAGATLEEREPDSPLVAKVRLARFTSDAPTLVVPDGNWDLLFVRPGSGPMVAVQSGQIATPLCETGWRHTEVLAISFRPEIYMPRSPAKRTRALDCLPAVPDEAVARPELNGFGDPAAAKLGRLVLGMNGALRPTEHDRRFWIGPERLEIPDFENAEQLVARMVRRGLLEKDRVVERAMRGVRQRLDERTIQRHFAAVAGISYKRIRQIERAHQAARLLRQALPAVRVAAELGYSDQAHLSHSLKRLLGLTPRQIAAR